MTQFQKYLLSIDACVEARQWVAGRTLAQAWDSCPRVDWLHWFATAEARRAYQAATDEARRTYEAATDEARRTYEAATDEARRTYEAATDEARRTYEAARTPDEYRAAIACPFIPDLASARQLRAWGLARMLR